MISALTKIKAVTGIAKSICDCGHIGDGSGGDHGDRFVAGHGACLVPGCDCKQFTWAGWLDGNEDVSVPWK